MSTGRWAGASFGLLLGCFSVAGGCGSDDSPPGEPGDGGLGGDASSDACVKNCRPQDGSDGSRGSSLGTSCTTDTDCGGGLTCQKPTDNIAPGSGPPNGLCTAECSTKANHDLCDSLNGICVSFSTVTTKSFCMDHCTTGDVTPPEAKCHGRLDTVCGELVDPTGAPVGFACIPLCATNADCGSRKCDLGTGLCSDFVTPGAPIGSSCMLDSDCAGSVCYPFVRSDAASSPGVCSAVCRLGNGEGCGFRTTPLDAGPPVGACLLSTAKAPGSGDIGICAQLCDSVADCTTEDSRWTCILDAGVRQAFRHAGYCWFGARPDGGATKDAAAPETGTPETGAPEASPPEASPPEASPPEASPPEASADTLVESGSDAIPDGPSTDAVTPPADGTTD